MNRGNKLEKWDRQEQKYMPDTRAVGDILLKRAELEGRYDSVRMFREQEQKLITTQSGADDKLKLAEIKKVNDRKIGADKKTDLIDEIEAKYDTINAEYKERYDRLENWKASSPEDMATLNKELQTKPVGDQRGTLFTMPLQVLKDEARVLKAMDESDMIYNVKTEKTYFLSGNSMFEVLDDSFRPGMATTSDEVVQQRKIIGYAKGPGMGENASFDISVMDSTISEPDYTGFGMQTQSKTSGKTGLAWTAHDPNKNPLGIKLVPDNQTKNPFTGQDWGDQGLTKNINKEIQIDNMILLDTDWVDNIATVDGKQMLRKMDSQEVLQLKRGNTLGKLTDTIQIR